MVIVSRRYLLSQYGFSILRIVRENPKAIELTFGGKAGEGEERKREKTEVAKRRMRESKRNPRDREAEKVERNTVEETETRETEMRQTNRKLLF